LNVAEAAVIGRAYIGVSEQDLIRGKLRLVRADSGNSGIAGRARTPIASDSAH